jgi:hypothetical protein
MAGADYVVAFVTFLELLALPLSAILPSPTYLLCQFIEPE